MRALVTGGAGFIGSNVVDALVARGDTVTVVDDLSSGRRENVDDAVDFLEVDVRDRGAFTDVVRGSSPEVIFHLAAATRETDPRADMQVTVGGTLNVLEAARGAGVRRVVSASDGRAIYGEGKMIPADEHHPMAPESAVGVSKLCAEGYCDLYKRRHGLSSVSLRYGSAYGPRGEAGVIAIFCGKALDGGRPTVYGDGLQTRDYVFVGDVVAANLAAAGASVTGPVNIGTGTETSVLDLVAVMAERADGSFEAEHAPERQGEVRHIALDSTLARAELDWRAEIGLADGLDRTLDALR